MYYFLLLVVAPLILLRYHCSRTSFIVYYLYNLIGPLISSIFFKLFGYLKIILVVHRPHSDSGQNGTVATLSRWVQFILIRTGPLLKWSWNPSYFRSLASSVVARRVNWFSCRQPWKILNGSPEKERLIALTLLLILDRPEGCLGLTMKHQKSRTTT